MEEKAGTPKARLSVSVPGLGAICMALKLLSATTLFAMMGVTAVDVVGRYLLSAPLPGAFEITQVMMGILVFSVLPIVSAADDHISIGLFDGWFFGTKRYVKQAVVSLISAIFVGTAAWRMWIESGRMAEHQDRSAYLGMPLWPLAYFMSAMMAATLTALVILTLLNLRAAIARAN